MEVDEIIHVTHAEIVAWRTDPHVQYVIRTRSKRNPSMLYVTRRRAKFFNVLHGQLKKIGRFKDVPVLPVGSKGIPSLTKIISGKNFDCSDIQTKRLGYEMYLRDLVAHPDIRNSVELLTFLGCTPCNELDFDGSPRSSRSDSSISEVSRLPPPLLQLAATAVVADEGDTVVAKIKEKKIILVAEDEESLSQQFSSKYISSLIVEIATLKSQLEIAQEKIILLLEGHDK
jgi:hypothetical protein